MELAIIEHSMPAIIEHAVSAVMSALPFISLTIGVVAIYEIYLIYIGPKDTIFATSSGGVINEENGDRNSYRILEENLDLAKMVINEENGDRNSYITDDIMLLKRRIDLLEKEIDRRDSYNKWLIGVLFALSLGLVTLATSVAYTTVSP